MNREDAALVEQMYDELRRFAAVVAPWDFDPDDVLHAVLLKILARHRLSSLGDPGAYARRSIVNHVNSELRRVRTRRLVLPRLGAPTPAVDAYPSDLGDLARLDPIDRAVLYLHDVEGAPFDEVAEMLGMKAGRARVRASRARSRLRTALNEEFEA